MTKAESRPQLYTVRLEREGVGRLHETTGDDLGLIEHPAPNLEPGDAFAVPESGRSFPC